MFTLSIYYISKPRLDSSSSKILTRRVNSTTREDHIFKILLKIDQLLIKFSYGYIYILNNNRSKSLNLLRLNQ